MKATYNDETKQTTCVFDEGEIGIIGGLTGSMVLGPVRTAKFALMAQEFSDEKFEKFIADFTATNEAQWQEEKDIDNEGVRYKTTTMFIEFIKLMRDAKNMGQPSFVIVE